MKRVPKSKELEIEKQIDIKRKEIEAISKEMMEGKKAMDRILTEIDELIGQLWE